MIQAVEDVRIALDVEAAGDAAIKKKSARTRKIPTSKKGISRTRIIRDSWAAGIVTARSTGNISVPS